MSRFHRLCLSLSFLGNVFFLLSHAYGTDESYSILSGLHDKGIQCVLAFRTMAPNAQIELSGYSISDGDPDITRCLIFTNNFLQKTIALSSPPMETIVMQSGEKWSRRKAFNMNEYVNAALLCTNHFSISEYVERKVHLRKTANEQNKTIDYGLAVVATAAIVTEKLLGNNAKSKRRFEILTNQYSVASISLGMKRSEIEKRFGAPRACVTNDMGSLTYAYAPEGDISEKVKKYSVCGIAYKDERAIMIFANRFFDFRLLDSPCESFRIETSLTNYIGDHASFTAAPEALCPSSTFDFGERSATATVTNAFPVVNTGDADLALGDARACCGAALSIPNPVVAPGATNLVIATLSLAGREPGRPFRKALYLATNDPAHPWLRFEFTGTVSPAKEPEDR